MGKRASGGDASRVPREQAGETRESLLRAAEKLFARHGIARASLRAITREAGANLASVHYHFGSKEALVRAVFSRRLAPLNQERLDLLERCERMGEGDPPLERVIHAFTAPVLRMIERQPGGSDFARLMMRALSEPDDHVRAIIMEQLAEVIRRFTAALRRALPQLPEAEIFWRFHFMVGAMVHTAGLGHFVRRYSGGLCDPLDVEGTTRRLLDFVAAGMRRPPVDLRKRAS